MCVWGLDESRVPADALDKSRGLAAQLLKLERAQEPEAGGGCHVGRTRRSVEGRIHSAGRSD
ncbi:MULTISPECIES: hypothetical protein, partial [unclassified Desulfovibrio]|uniref:hypothetical protein n=1 Tax=unclassified Desulfovibrio TaxID=2593640 RepID=UPI001C895D75